MGNRWNHSPLSIRIGLTDPAYDVSDFRVGVDTGLSSSRRWLLRPDKYRRSFDFYLRRPHRVAIFPIHAPLFFHDGEIFFILRILGKIRIAPAHFGTGPIAIRRSPPVAQGPNGAIRRLIPAVRGRPFSLRIVESGDMLSLSPSPPIR